MTELKKLNTRLLNAAKEVVGDDVFKVMVFFGYGWTLFVKTHKSALILEDLNKQNPLAEKVAITEYYEEIDVNDENGELVDIINGKLLGYKIEVKLRQDN